MRGQHFTEVHPVELVTGEDQDVIDVGLFEVTQVLTHGVRRALIPVGDRGRLFCCQNLYPAGVKKIKVIGLSDMPIQRNRIELGQDGNTVYTRV